MWRCPHCGTPQAETSRCWVCKRSSTSCGTCRHFRRAIAGQLGYCGLDRRRLPLRGDELRGCWESATPATEADGLEPAGRVPGELRPRLEFIPVDQTVEPTASVPDRIVPPPPPADRLLLGFWADER